MTILPKYCDKCHDYIKYGLYGISISDNEVPNYYCSECFVDITGQSPSQYFYEREKK